MTQKRPVPPHNDSGFVSGFTRYLVGEAAVQSSTWDEFVERAQKIDSSTDYFQEYRFFNLIIMVEHNLSPYLEKSVELNEVVDESALYAYIAKQTQRYRSLTPSDTAALIESETEGKDIRLLSPHGLFYIAGITLGTLTHIVRSYLKPTAANKQLVGDLTRLNELRTDVFHQALSSRVQLNLSVQEGLSLGSKILSDIQA